MDNKCSCCTQVKSNFYIFQYLLSSLVNEPEVPLVLYMGFSNVQLLVLERSLYLFLLILERSLKNFDNFDWTVFDGYSYFYSPIFIAS